MDMNAAFPYVLAVFAHFESSLRYNFIHKEQVKTRKAEGNSSRPLGWMTSTAGKKWS